ncbi:hypothetical protein J7K43_06630 [Candidatus Calescamantes bacterium]|nr:hypothetical protein [Candidatus Calescamantes bacterium]
MKPLFLSVLSVVLMWATFVLPGINWGLPNSVGFEVDGAGIPRPHYSGLDMMKASACNYPPLQYLFFQIISPERKEKVKSLKEYVDIASSRMVRFRLLTALMVLGTAILIFLLAGFFKLPMWGRVLSSFLYLSHGMSNYYAHTTNLDQPYMFWWVFSLYGLFLYLKGLRMENKRGYIIAGSLIFGICMFLSIATKDHSYASYPFFIFLLFWVKKWNTESRKYFWLTAGLAVGGAIYLCIYKMAGGWPVFATHFNWITHQGVERFREVKGTFSGRTTLALIALKDFYHAFGFPLLMLFISGGGIWIFKVMREKDEWMKVSFISFFLPVFSIFFLFLQVVRFSAPRFWFPVLPFICITSAYGINFILKHRRWKLLVFGIFPLILWNSLGGVEVIYILKNDPRVLIREEIKSFVSKNEVIGIIGSSFGKKYVLNPVTHSQHPVETVRDWSQFSFGILSPKQISLLDDPFSIYPLSPPILLGYSLPPEKIYAIKKMGYSLLKEISSLHPKFNLFGGLPELSIFLFSLKNHDAIPQPSNLTLEEQLMVIHSLKRKLRGNQVALRRIGELAREFHVPDLKNKTIDDEDIELLAIGYTLAKREKSALEAFDFLCQNWPTPLHLRNRELCYKILKGEGNK